MSAENVVIILLVVLVLLVALALAYAYYDQHQKDLLCQARGYDSTAYVQGTWFCVNTTKMLVPMVDLK